jgi:hypothetical protein
MIYECTRYESPTSATTAMQVKLQETKSINRLNIALLRLLTKRLGRAMYTTLIRDSNPVLHPNKNFWEELTDYFPFSRSVA